MEPGAFKKKLEEEKNLSKKNVSFTKSIIQEFLIKPSFLKSITYINIVLLYFAIILYLAGYTISYWYLLFYFPIIFGLNYIRQNKKERDRIEITHMIPFFADALANALSVGVSLEEAFVQASYYLKGKIKEEFYTLTLKAKMGQDLQTLLREMDVKFPDTGLIYLISLLSAYNNLGVGISPLLKRISKFLTQKEEAEEKIRTILTAGSNYAWLSIGIFTVIFIALGYMLRDQMKFLLSPQLKPIFLFLLAWAFVGIIIVTRMTSLDYTRNFSIKPYIVKFLNNRKLTHEEILNYSGIEWTWGKRQILKYSPFLLSLIFAYLTSFYYESFMAIFISFFIGYFLAKFLINFLLKSMVEDQLIKTVEIFPEVLQIFTIGLNSGLNNFLAFRFAQDSIEEKAPKILIEELCRANFAMECGEEHSKTWQRLAERLPFESVVDFSEIMAMAPIHGESISNSIIQMINGYQEKKLLLIEKKATKLSQVVIPIIIVAFFPLFLFFLFAPTILKITSFLIE